MKACIAVFGLLLGLGGAAQAQQTPATPQEWVHPGSRAMKAGGYDGAQTCLMCHPKALDEVVHTVHWNLATPVRNVQGLPDGSWWGMVNRECALAGSTSPANWVAATNGKASVQAAGCGLCHVGALPAPPVPGKPATDAQTNTVDCLVCHAKDYDWQKRATLVTDATGVHWGQDTSLAAALSITKTPTTQACLRCHGHALSEDYKRGTPFTAENDVHAKAGVTCVQCHVTQNHLVAKGLNESDMIANDLPDVAVTCSKCHGETPHTGANADRLNQHVAKLACQTCHIPEVAGIVYDNWGKPVKDDINGPVSELSKYDNIPSIAGLYVPTDSLMKGHPTYIWRVANTADAKNAQSWMAFATTDINTPGAKIFPARPLTQVMLFDKSMKMWQMPGMEFLKANPQMADFPMLLAPNREVYNKTGDVKAAIDSGMSAMGVKWSGEWMPMQVPGTSYISVNHGIKATGPACNSCHAPNGIIDFKALGFTADQVKQLTQNR
jgi:Cytochrome c bacterial/Cytochrome c554 and c-prime